MAKRYQPQALLSEQGGVQTFSGRDALNGLPVRLYSFMGQPTSKAGELSSLYIPPVLESNFVGGAGEVVTAFSPDFQPLAGPVSPQQVEALLRHTAAALDDAARAGVVHGDLTPDRVLFDHEAGGRFLLEGYSVPWRVRPSESSPPERIGGATFAGDLFSWAMTVRHLSGPLPGDLRDLLARCLSADPKTRPHAREVRAALDGYAFSPRPQTSHPQAARDESAFENFAVGETGTRSLEEDDLTPKETSGWHIPLPTPAGATERTSPAEDTSSLEAPRVEVSGLEMTAPPSQVEDSALPEIRRDAVPKPIVQETDLPPESLRRTDGTSAYRVRRERLQAGAQTRPQATDIEAAPASLANQSATTRATSSTTRANERPEQGSSRSHAADTPVLRNSRPSANRFGPQELEPVQAPDPGEDFEVVDDIDERAPDPTQSRGGLRVLLSTLLVIAIVVLLALQVL